ncbi:MAG: DNA polymerase III subunit beta [Oscillospiraceae bacterium]
MDMFKLVCDKQELSEAVQGVGKAVSERSPITALEGILFRLNGATLELTGYDLEIGIRTSVSVRSADKGQVVCDAKLFTEIIRKMPEGELLIEVSDNLQVRISGGMTEYQIPACAADEYPELPVTGEGESFALPQGVLKSMIGESLFAVSQKDDKPILRGELFEIDNGVMNLVALDGHRLAVRTESVKNDGGLKFVVPAKSLSEVARLLKDDDAAGCTIHASKKHIIFEFKGYFVYSRLLEGEFHPYRSAIPKGGSTEVVVSTKDFISCLDRASLLINEKISSPVKCVFGDGKINVSCSTMFGAVNDDVYADITGPVIKIGFKCKYLLDALKAVKSDKVRLSLDGSWLPMKILPVKGDAFLYLVLPVKIKAD